MPRRNIMYRPIVSGIETVQLRLGEFVLQGDSQMVIRMRLEDRSDVNAAARLLGVTQAQFVRSVLVQTARAVIAEAKSREVA